MSIHLAIGVVEGLVTAAVAVFVRDARPDLVLLDPVTSPLAFRPIGRLGGTVLLTAALLAGVVSWFASSKPDGLEWSIDHAQQQGGVRLPEGALHSFFSGLQSRTGLLAEGAERASESWPAVSPRSSLAGLAGAGLTLGLAILIGFGIRAVRRGASSNPARSLE